MGYFIRKSSLDETSKYSNVGQINQVELHMKPHSSAKEVSLPGASEHVNIVATNV